MKLYLPHIHIKIHPNSIFYKFKNAHKISIYIHTCIYYVARGSQEAKAFKRDHIDIIYGTEETLILLNFSKKTN